MKTIAFLICILSINVLTEAKEIDVKLLRCLVCRSTVKEIEGELGKIDASREMEIGNYRLDAQGNTVQKKVPLAQSEVHISDMLDNICEKMTDYVRATYKSNGELTILNLMDPNGGMNPEMSKVDIIQDGDMNKSLKYYCEGIVEEFEDPIISLLSQKESNVKKQLCTDITRLCSTVDFAEDEDTFDEENIDEDHDEL